MEIILNVAWALFSLALMGLWVRGLRSNPAPLRTQVFSLAMVVLLLLPVISLSDDLMAMQGPAETDTCVRKAQHASDVHPPVALSCLALPAPVVTLSLAASGQILRTNDCSAESSRFLSGSLDSRPPPQA